MFNKQKSINFSLKIYFYNYLRPNKFFEIVILSLIILYYKKLLRL